MGIPHRGRTSTATYFVTACTWGKRPLFQTERLARLMLDVLSHYRSQRKYQLHEFVIMPDHFHLLLTPTESLERALQLIKGGFSFRAKKEMGFGGEVWQNSFHDRRVRDAAEYQQFRRYIHENPVKRGLAAQPSDHGYCSAAGVMPLDDVPQRLKPHSPGAEPQA